jgi:hypothetical protein
MTKYKCGHDTDGVIIMDSNELSIAVYLVCAEGVGLNGTREKCFDCYCKTAQEMTK